MRCTKTSKSPGWAGSGRTAYSLRGTTLHAPSSGFQSTDVLSCSPVESLATIRAPLRSSGESVLHWNTTLPTGPESGRLSPSSQLKSGLSGFTLKTIPSLARSSRWSRQNFQ